MASGDVLITEGTPIAFGVAGSFSPADVGTDWTHGVGITAVLTLASLADGSGRQSAKVDLGAARAPVLHLLACVDFTGETPVAGDTVDYFWLPSTSGTQGTGNVAGNSGADAAAPDGAVPSGLTVDEVRGNGYSDRPARSVGRCGGTKRLLSVAFPHRRAMDSYS